MTAEIQEPTDCAPRAYVPFQPAVKSGQPQSAKRAGATFYLCKDNSFCKNTQIYGYFFNNQRATNIFFKLFVLPLQQI